MADRSEPSVKSIHNMKTSLIPAAENWPRGQCSSSRHRPHSAFLMATLLVVSLLAAVLGLGFHGYYSQRNDFLPIRSLSSIECPPNKVVETICKHTADADVCVRELGNYEFSSSATPLEIIIAAIQSAAKRVSESEGVANECRGESGLSKLEGECTEDCMELLVRVADLVKDASTRISSLRDSSDLTTFSSALMDVKAWLSSALSLQTACSDNFDVASGSIQIRIQSNQAYLGEVIGYVLSLIDILAEVGNNVTTWQGNLPPIYHFIRGPHHHQRRRLLSTVPFFNMEDGFPYWVSAGERRLLQDSSSSIAASANSVVAKDGSGQFLSIMDALNNIPGNYSGRYIIYIKQGVYEEVFNVTKDQKNITLVGDGIGKTIITGDRNVASGNYNTYRTSTVGKSIRNFISNHPSSL
ncbi:hypothetical protein KP509_16G076000 [Ceratopteris richardii]|uniref:Pectinesterase inhibitor domain-containing protein n=1 Tax=Ceratopteris richardii TaxID=49495 RepID=A0A8T2T494_CERRI|nr:hypothetical protein KP509_16G076000 [Ceratopteris richardii]